MHHIYKALTNTVQLQGHIPIKYFTTDLITRIITLLIIL